MSIESAKAFMERMKTDREFAEQVKTSSGKEARMEIVSGAGYEFTPEEIESVREQLSDEELDAVAGGLWGIAECDDYKWCAKGYDEQGRLIEISYV